jgi:hypothetical protein
LAQTIYKRKNFWLWLSLSGLAIFTGLYIAATFFYPGGSQADKASPGFSWTHNYWCNLLDKTAINGRYNKARPIAITAMAVLAVTLAFFWYIFPKKTVLSNPVKAATQISGIISMALGMALFVGPHDMIINASGFFGLIAIWGTLSGLLKQKWRTLFWAGIFNVVLIGLNNILYYGYGLLACLPVIQKISFLSFLLWICLIDLKMFRKTAATTQAGSESSHF